MLRQLLGFSLVGMLLIGAPVEAQKKNTKNQPKTATADIDADTLPPGEFSGKLLSAPMPASGFMVEISYQTTSLKPGARLPNQYNQNNQLTRHLQQIARLEAQIQSARTPQQAAQHMAQLQMQMAQLQQSQAYNQLRQSGAVNNLMQVTTTKKTVEFHAGDDITVRRLNLPVEFDEKGKPKQYTAEEKRKLKGSKPNLPGYEAKLEDLTTGTIVKVTTAVNKAAKSQASSTATKDEKGVSDQPKTTVTMIMILGDDPNAKTMTGDPKAKK